MTREAATKELRMKYEAAVAAHEHLMRAVTAAIGRGEAPSVPLLDSEAKAAREANSARSDYLMALAAG
jgi:hypothetical protein